MKKLVSEYKTNIFYQESSEKLSHSAIHTSCLTDTNLGPELVTQMWKHLRTPCRRSATPRSLRTWSWIQRGITGDLPVCVCVIDHQQDFGFLCHGGHGPGRVIHQSRGRLGGLLHGAGDGAEDAAAAAGGWVRGLGWLQVLSLRGRRHRGARGAVGALQVHHVAIGQVGHETTVRETPPQEIHCCSAVGKLLSKSKAEQCCCQSWRMSLCPGGYPLKIQAGRHALPLEIVLEIYA